MPAPSLPTHLNRMHTWMRANVQHVNMKANSATVLLVCCYLDALAGFYVGRDTETTGRHRANSKSDFLDFAKKYMTGFMAAAVNGFGRERSRSVRVDRCAPICGGNRRKVQTYADLLYNS